MSSENGQVRICRTKSQLVDLQILAVIRSSRDGLLHFPSFSKMNALPHRVLCILAISLEVSRLSARVLMSLTQVQEMSLCCRLRPTCYFFFKGEWDQSRFTCWEDDRPYSMASIFPSDFTDSESSSFQSRTSARGTLFGYRDWLKEML